MSNALTFSLGAGGGLALWYFLRDKRATATPPTTETPTPGTSTTEATTRNARPAARACAVRLDGSALTVDGACVSVAEAVRRCQAAGGVDLAIAPGAPAATSLDLISALRRANLPAYRNAGGGASTRNPETKDRYTLITYARGKNAGPTLRWFRAETPITWIEARDRLAAAGLVDLQLAGRTYVPGGWMLSVDAHDFVPDRAEPLPGVRNADTSATFTLMVYPQGINGSTKRVHWFLADPPVTWEAARDRLAAAHRLDPLARAPRDAGYWRLVTEPRVFDAERAKPLPDPPRRTRGAGRTGRFTLEGGRTIARDDEPILHLERIDLGDQRYAISPHHADVLAARIVRLLNQHGAR